MFVRIVTREHAGASGEPDVQGSDSVRECRLVEMLPFGESCVLLRFDEDADGIHGRIAVEKAHSEVYYMNSDGRTIDSYRWNS